MLGKISHYLSFTVNEVITYYKTNIIKFHSLSRMDTTDLIKRVMINSKVFILIPLSLIIANNDINSCFISHASPWENRIHPIHGDVQDVFHSLVKEGKKYDFIFMDAAKGQYIRYLPDAAALLRTGGVLVSDNVLQDMTILDSHFALERRERTIHKRMRDYLYELTHHPGLLTTVVPIGDGAAVTIRKEDYA